jgi:hypothetical protein
VVGPTGEAAGTVTTRLSGWPCPDGVLPEARRAGPLGQWTCVTWAWLRRARVSGERHRKRGPIGAGSRLDRCLSEKDRTGAPLAGYGERAAAQARARLGLGIRKGSSDAWAAAREGKQGKSLPGGACCFTVAGERAGGSARRGSGPLAKEKISENHLIFFINHRFKD